MNLGEFVDSISDFGLLSPTEQIKRFCWYLIVDQQKSSFAGADIARCFADANCPKPSSIHPFLTSLSNRKPPFLLRQGNAFKLSRNAQSELDEILGQRESTIAADKALRDLPSRLHVDCERVFLEEALTCFKHRAFRATIVMTWNLAYDHLCSVLFDKHLAAFNSQLPRSFPKADTSSIASKEQFALLKEHQVLQVAKSANIISNSLHKVLQHRLDDRNIAAHPSGIVISSLTTEAFVIDLVQNVVLRL